MARPLATTQSSTTGGRSLAPAPTQGLAHTIWNGIASVGNLVAGGASDLGTHLGQGAASVTADAAGALGFKDEQQKIKDRLAAGQTNLFGAPVETLKPGVSGLKQLGGDTLKTGAEFGAAVAAPVTVPGAILSGGAIGAAQGAGDALQKDKSAIDILKEGGVGALIGSVTGGAVSGIGKLIGAVGDKIMTSVIKPVKADIEDGFSIATVKKYNLGGSLNTTLTKTQDALSNLTSQLHAKLASSPEKIDLNNVLNDTIKDLTDSSKLKGFGANTKIANGLQQLRDEINIVHTDGPLSIPEAQIVKQAAGTFGAWQYGKPDPESKATEIIYNTFYNKLKTAIEQHSPEGVRDINQQLSKLIPVMNAVVRRLPVADRSNLISLNEMIGLVGSSVNPIALGPTLLSLISKSGAAGSLLSKLGPNASRLANPASLLTSTQAEPVSDITKAQ